MPERRRWPKGAIANGLATAFLVGLAVSPIAFRGTFTPPWVQSAERAAAVPLGPAAAALPGIKLSPVATPVDGELEPALLPTLDSTHMAALVAGEDLRLRTLLHHARRLQARHHAAHAARRRHAHQQKLDGARQRRNAAEPPLI